MKRAFRIVGVRDVEVQDYEYPTRLENDQKLTPRPIRNEYNYPNFISLYIDKLEEVKKFLQDQKIPFENERDGLVTIPPLANKEKEFFNLCDNPTFVELVQATDDIVQEYSEEDQKILSPDQQ